MNLPDGVLPSWMILISWAVYGPLIFFVLKQAPWYKVRGDHGAQSIFFVMTLAVMMLWQMDAQIAPGLSFHFLGAAILTLMFGPRFAIISLSLALAGVTYNDHSGLEAFAFNLLLTGALPVILVWLGYLASRRWMAKHFFVYTFFNAFLMAGISTAITLVLLGITLGWLHVQDWYRLKMHFFPIIPMVAGPEAFINGFFMTALVAYKPEWIATFRDEEYLHGK